MTPRSGRRVSGIAPLRHPVVFQRMAKKKKTRRKPDPPAPSPLQIFVQCRRLQAQWDDAERRRRAGLRKPVPWAFPVVLQEDLWPERRDP